MSTKLINKDTALHYGTDASYLDANGNLPGKVALPSQPPYAPPNQSHEDARYQGRGGYGCWRGEATPERWVRRLGYGEKFMTGAADFGVMSTIYNLWFEAEKPIELDHIKRASYIVAQKLPHLKLCVNKKNGALWYREMEQLNLDVEEKITDDIMNTFETFLRKKFDIERGPMWFVRFIKITETNDSSHTAVLNPNFKHRFVCLFGFHHNFTDGTSNAKFCDVFLKVLNDIMLDRTPDMSVEAKLSEPHHDRLSDQMKAAHPIRNNLYLMYYFCKRLYKGVVTFGHQVRNYTKHYEQQPGTHSATLLIPSELDEETTSKLLQRCRQEKATLNSAFTAAANLALYRMILEKDPSVNHTDFSGIQTVNARRYWTEEQRKDSCGCHITTLDLRVPTRVGDLQDIWGYARKIQEMMMYELDVSKRGVRLISLGEKLRIVLYMNSFLEWAGFRSANDNHFCITNMGNLNKFFSGKGEVVEVTKVLRSVSGHYMNNLCQHTLHTFRGKLYYSLDYYAQKMKREDALKYSEYVLQLLNEFISVPSSTCLSDS